MFTCELCRLELCCELFEFSSRENPEALKSERLIKVTGVILADRCVEVRSACPFSGVTEYSRVGRKAPDARN